MPAKLTNLPFLRSTGWLAPSRAPLIAWLLAALLAVAAGCDDGPEPEPDGGAPCQGVACTGHGVCVASGDEATCDCDDGYHAAGLECLADGAPCDGIDCSGRGVCVASGAEATCDCDDGYHAAGLECLADGDPCDGVTCSGHGACAASGGVASCDCDEGYAAAGLACVVASAASDPVTTPLEGSGTVYNVGPGQDYEEPDTVPWGALVAGDVVNIYFRDAPYTWKLCLRGQGTAADPIVVNGVTDASGNRPRFEFDGARTASGCNPGGDDDVFDIASEWSLEDYAGIIVREGVNDDWDYRPAWIEIRNLELSGASPGASFIDLSGATRPYSDAPAAIWVQPSTDLLIENCVISDAGFGVFTMAKDSDLNRACERITLRSNRIFGCGVVGSYTEHNVYMQAANPVVEGNSFGILRAGAEGSSYKSRSSGEIFRYNFVVASARAADFVYSEDQTPGIATQPDYGVDYVYGNVFVNDCSLELCASAPIHYGGDNQGEQEDDPELFVPETPYRSHLYFYNNTVVHNVDQDASWRTTIFDLSERGTLVEAWNNVFSLSGTSNFSWVQSAGDLRLSGTNLAFGTVAEASDMALDANYAVTIDGTLLTGDPLFVDVATYDVRLGAGSPAIGAATGVPAAFSPDPAYAETPVTRQPTPGSNGMSPRTALDLGALEFE